MTKGYRFHFSERLFYFVDLEAESLDDAKEQLRYFGTHHQNNENGNYLENHCIVHEDEDVDNDEQWEEIPVEDIKYP